MKSLFRALHAEILKLRRTLALRMIFVAPLLVVLLQFFMTLNQRRVPAGFKLWESTFQNALSIWSIFMLPLLVTLETALLAGIEHGEKQWKHLLALPVPRSGIYAAKLLIAALLALLSTLALCALLAPAGYALMALRPELAQAGGPDYVGALRQAGRIWVAAWLIIALHTWISIRWASFTIALGAGVGGTFFALFAASARIGKYYPWLLPVNTMNLIAGEPRERLALLLGGVGGAVVAALGCAEFVWRDAGEADSLLRRRTMLLGGAAVLAVAALGAYLQMPKAKPAPGGPANARRERVENGLLSAVVLTEARRPMKLADRMEYYRVPGVGIAVIENGSIAWAKGYGVLEANRDEPVTTETRFQAASISKSLTAVATLALAEQGRLDLDEDVNGKLRSWQVPDNEFTREQKVTPRRLLSHTAGLGEHKSAGYDAGAPMPTPLQALDGLPPASTPPVRVERVPGSAFHYSGGGYLVLQQLLCDVTGKSFSELMRELVFDRVGMPHSSFAQPLPKELEAVAARGHGNDGAVIPGRWRLHPELAAAGLWTTPSDLARLLIDLWNAQRGGAKSVLTPEMARRMMTKERNEYGLGILLGGKERRLSFGHEGSNIGYKCAMVMFFDTGHGAVVMTNGEQGGVLFGEILRSLAQEYNWPSYRPVERAPVPIDPAVLAAYAGRYELGEPDAQGVIVAQVENGKLYLRVPTLAGRSMELYPLGENQFFMLEENAEISFVKDARGAVTGLRARTATEDVTARRLP